jgi:hypothetical protein
MFEPSTTAAAIGVPGFVAALAASRLVLIWIRAATRYRGLQGASRAWHPLPMQKVLQKTFFSQNQNGRPLEVPTCNRPADAMMEDRNE